MNVSKLDNPCLVQQTVAMFREPYRRIALICVVNFAESSHRSVLASVGCGLGGFHFRCKPQPSRLHHRGFREGTNHPTDCRESKQPNRSGEQNIVGRNAAESATKQRRAECEASQNSGIRFSHTHHPAALISS
jgi:hypothetical protein